MVINSLEERGGGQENAMHLRGIPAEDGLVAGEEIGGKGGGFLRRFDGFDGFDKLTASKLTAGRLGAFAWI